MLIAMALSPSELRRYSRHLSLSEIGLTGQERLRAARVLIVGAGGLGSPAALYLAAAGIGTLGVIDFDRIDESNLQRQVLFDTASVGQSKALCARERLQALNPDVRVIAHALELQSTNVRSLFDDYDLIVDGSDRVGTHYLINDACVLYRKSLVLAAIYRFEGQIMSYRPDAGPCYRCLFPGIDARAAPSCAETGVLGVLPGVMGSLQATEAIKLIAGIGTPLLGRLLTYDALDLRFHELRLARRADCPVCGDRPTILAPFDPPGFCAALELQSVRSVDAASLERELRSERPPLLIDVREPAEFAAGHLARSVSVPLSQIERDGWRLDPAQPVVFVCRSGVRSQRASALAQGHGARNMRELSGGLLAWRRTVDPTLAVADS